MDEILYWIHTKRAPCLFKYDKSINHYDKSITKPIHNDCKNMSSPNNKKRKLVMFDDSESSIEQQNIFFEPSEQRKKQIIDNTNCKSESVISDVDFNIKNSSVENKWKKPKLPKNAQSVLHKKNKVITSTPIINRSLRRSLRKVEKTLNQTNFNTSFELLNDSGVNQRRHCSGSVTPHSKLTKELNNISTESKNGFNTENVTKTNKVNTTVNGQFEDLSDVSGFTANYIRSTKLHYLRTPRMLRTKVKKNLVKEHETTKRENNVVCVNKSINSNLPISKLNRIDTSKNIFDLITNNNAGDAKVSRNTSISKLINLKQNNTKQKSFQNKLQDNGKQTNTTKSSQHRSSPRLPKQHQNNQSQDITLQTAISPRKSLVRRREKNKNELKLLKSRENPEESIMTRRRSRRYMGVKGEQLDSSVLVLDNTADQEKPLEVLNVANDTVHNKKQLSAMKKKHKKSLHENVTLNKESLREKSGFAACFSDSDDEPLKSNKFFG